jgi:hypothetical protein
MRRGKIPIQREHFNFDVANWKFDHGFHVNAEAGPRDLLGPCWEGPKQWQASCPPGPFGKVDREWQVTCGASGVLTLLLKEADRHAPAQG